MYNIPRERKIVASGIAVYHGRQFIIMYMFCIVECVRKIVLAKQVPECTADERIFIFLSRNAPYTIKAVGPLGISVLKCK